MADNVDVAPLQLKKASIPASVSVPVDAVDTTPTCYLLDKIPAEMRNTIYELVFTAGHNDDAPVDICKTAPPSKALTMTCRQICHESRGLYKSANRDFWQGNHFIMEPSSTLLSDIESLREDDLQHIRHLKAHYQRDGTTVNQIMLSNAGVWKQTVTLNGTTLMDYSYLVYHEIVLTAVWDFVYDEKRAMDQRARRQPKPSMK